MVNVTDSMKHVHSKQDKPRHAAQLPLRITAELVRIQVADVEHVGPPVLGAWDIAIDRGLQGAW